MKNVIATDTPGPETVCASCSISPIPGRAYDLKVAHLVVTLCQPCRKGFDSADDELDSDRIYRDWQDRHPDEMVDMTVPRPIYIEFHPPEDSDDHLDDRYPRRHRRGFTFAKG